MQKFLRISEVARLLDVCPETVRVWFDQGELRGIRLPKTGERRVARESVDAILHGGREGESQRG